jgi:hypothetical protein
VDGNRTRQVEILGLTGFEDRGAHQDTFTSTSQAGLTPQIRHMATESALLAPDLQPVDCAVCRPTG